MKNMRRILALLMALTMLFGLVACAKDGKKKIDKNVLPVCLSSEPDTIDPALNSAVDGATMLVHLFAGLSKWAQQDDGTLAIAPDCVTELVDPVENADGTVTYTYTLRDGLKWSDGKDLVAGDFVYAWNRAASFDLAADYGYMFEVVDGYAKMTEAKETGEVNEDGEPILEAVYPDAKLNVQAPDDKTLVVTLANAVSYWDELLAFPTYFPVREDVVANEAWATDPATYVSNGPYKLTGWDHNSVITIEKNEHYYDAASITMPKIKFYLSDDSNNMLANFKSNEWLFIDDVPTNEIAALKKDYPNNFVVAGQIGTYYVCWNVNEEILPKTSKLKGVEAEKARAEIRQAIAVLFDRNYIVEEIAQGGQVPAASFVAMGMKNPDGTEFTSTAGTEPGGGYYKTDEAAIAEYYQYALEVFKKYYQTDKEGKLVDFPELVYLYNTSEGHKAIGEYLQSVLAGVGIKIKLENQEWATFLNTRKMGNYSVARNGWVADYSDPICFLDMWTTNSGNNDVQFGRGAHKKLAMYDLDLTGVEGYKLKVQNGTWAQTYDVLIAEIKACQDNVKRYKLMHIAEDMLMSTGCIVPIYFYTDLYMISDSVEGFYSSPLAYKYFMYTKIK
ncbi:MAG: peptide ABC transporter substrate-binding protein [Ruminococcaceae bacterium]|nr:peptide ABC transporter substrate-binding protein [Oscillospiraceae bacterium]